MMFDFRPAVYHTSPAALFRAFWDKDDPAEERAHTFYADIRETDSGFLLEADLPGFRKEDIHVDVEDDVLTVRAERHSDAEDTEKRGTFLRRERGWGIYERSYNVEAVDTDNISVRYADGVLTLTLPKKAPKAENKRHFDVE